MKGVSTVYDSSGWWCWPCGKTEATSFTAFDAPLPRHVYPYSCNDQQKRKNSHRPTGQMRHVMVTQHLNCHLPGVERDSSPAQ